MKDRPRGDDLSYIPGKITLIAGIVDFSDFLGMYHILFHCSVLQVDHDTFRNLVQSVHQNVQPRLFPFR